MKRSDFLLGLGLGITSMAVNPLKALEQVYQASQRRDPFIPLDEIISLRDKLIQEPELKKIGYDKKNIDDLFMHPDFHLHHYVENSFNNSAENLVGRGKKTYEWYRKLIKIEDKIENSGKFRLKCEKELIEAEQKYGVERRIIVGLLGIESDFGNFLGDYKAFNALVSGATTPNDSSIRDRSYEWLKHLLILCKNKNIPIYNLKSSYAGAIGPMQFMPDSLNDFFVGENPLSIKDAIFSVANFIKNKWYIYDEECDLKVKAAWDMNEKLEDTIQNVINYRTKRIRKTKDNVQEYIEVTRKDIESKTNNRLAIEKYNPSDTFVRAVLEIAIESDKAYGLLKQKEKLN